MKVLLLGGGVCVGRHIVEDSLERGWEVTLLTRGSRSLPDFGEPVTHVRGDRRRALEDLRGTWDAVIDTCGYHPNDVASSVNTLGTRAGCYVFVSSASVYPDETEVGDETLELDLPSNPEAMDPGRSRDYGPLKLACERAVREGVGDRSLIVRPGLIVGPYDPTDRFGYWPMRMSVGGTVLAPGRPTDHVQLIDGRDHAAFINNCLESAVFGTINVASDPVHLADVLAACTPQGSDVQVRWIDSSLLHLNRVQPWTELPLWYGARAAPCIATARALSAGLAVRPLSETAADTLAWEDTRVEHFPRPSQMTSERERELLALYG